MSESKSLSFRLDPVLSQRLEKLAANTQQSPFSLVSEAVLQYLALNEWHLEASRNVALAGIGRSMPVANAGLQPIEDLAIAG